MVWRKVRKLTGKFIPSPLPTLKINDTLVTEPSEVAEKLGRHFSDISSPHNYSDEFRKVRDAQISLNFESDKFEAYNAKFSLREFREARISYEATAPGEDLIIYEMLKHLPNNAKRFLLKIMNKI